MTKPIYSRSADLSPAVGTRLTGEGVVTVRDVTDKGLHRMTVEAEGKYPDVEKWSAMLPKGARVMTHHYEERVNNVFVGVLRMFWKEG